MRRESRQGLVSPRISTSIMVSTRFRTDRHAQSSLHSRSREITPQPRPDGLRHQFGVGQPGPVAGLDARGDRVLQHGVGILIGIALIVFIGSKAGCGAEHDTVIDAQAELGVASILRALTGSETRPKC
jgi:hypothetical protein